jgi:predicted permease
MVSLPTFGWVLGGVVAARVGLLPQALNNRISRLSFNFGLPAMLFAGAAGVDYSTLSTASYLLAGILATLLVLGLSWLYSIWRRHSLPERGIFSQGAFRSNLAIMGLALCITAYGERGAQLAAMAVAVMTTLYNVLAVWVLNVSHGTNTSVPATLLGVIRNPLIIGISAGAALSVSGLPIPALVDTAGAFLSAFFLPLMLICVGGAMNLAELRSSGPLAWESTAWRLLVAPALTVLIAIPLGVENEALGVLFLLVATPAAASGYVMVVAARGDGVLAANIVVLTTLFSILTITLGFFALSLMGLVGAIR